MDEDGYESLSMRRLGAKLNVDPMAVYYHFPNKSALLDGVVELVMGGIDLSCDDPTQTVEERLCVAAHYYREALLAHPQAVQITAVRSLNTPASLRPVEYLLEILLGTGISHTDSLAFVNIFARFVRGMVLLEIRQMTDTDSLAQEDCTLKSLGDSLPTDEFPLLHKVMENGCFIGEEAEFERGARALIHGLLDEFANKEQAGDQDVK